MLKNDHNPFASEGFKVPSGTNNGHFATCVAVRIGETIDVRDTKNVTGPTLSFNKAEWAVFLEGVKNGEFDPE